ncbi:MAG: hypothetical protein WCB48_15635 [Casimicrobiaceae bacterium]
MRGETVRKAVKASGKKTAKKSVRKPAERPVKKATRRTLKKSVVPVGLLGNIQEDRRTRRK